MDSPIAFCFVLLTLLAVPGPTNTLLALSGATAGLRRSLALVLGVLAGYALSTAAQRAVFATLFEGSSTLEMWLRVLVASYLVYLSIRLWSTRAIEESQIGGQRVFVATFLNPKALIIALVLMPAEPIVPAFHFAALVVLTVAVSLVWIKAGVLAKRFSGGRYALVFPKVAAVALVAFAAVIVSSVFR